MVMKLARIIKAVSLACILLLVPACGKSESESTLSGSVNTGDLSEEKDASLELDVYGDVKVDKSEEMTVDFPAKVKEVFVKDGDLVKKGDKLLSLDLEDYRLEIKTKENEIRMDELELKKLEANRNPQLLESESIREELQVKQHYLTGSDPDLVPLENSLAIIEKSIKTAQNQYETNKQLFEIDSLSQEELTLSEQTLKSKQKEKADTLTAIEKVRTNRKLEVNALRSQLQSTKVQSSNTDQQKAFDIEKLKVKIETAKLELNFMKNKLNKPYIRGNDLIASSDNLIVYDIHCIKGTEISSEFGPLLKAMYQDTIYVTADIPEESLTHIKVGAPASVVLADEKAGVVTGKISKIANRASEKDGDTMIEAIIQINKGKELLKPGLTADIKINKEE